MFKLTTSSTTYIQTNKQVVKQKKQIEYEKTIPVKVAKMEKVIKKVYKNVFEIKLEDLNSNAIIQGKINKLDCFTNM